MVIFYILFAICGFISGSIMYSYLIAKHFYNVDITVEGEDGNPGMTNVMQCVGVKPGLLCLLLDFQKGFVPVFLASLVLDPENLLFSLVLVSPVLGHAFSPILKGKGGKAIAVTFGVFTGALTVGSNMLWSMCAIMILFSAVIVIKPHSLRMIIGMILQIICLLLSKDPRSLVLGGILASVVVIIKHMMNYGTDKAEVKIPFFKKR